ncbi:MAG: hypothetical protein ACXWZR_00580 [Mycobacterium sp.]
MAWSLAVRDGFPLSLGLALWAAYYRHLAAGLNGLPAIGVDYVALTDDPAKTTGSLFAALARLGMAVSAEPAVAAAAVHPTLRRATVPGDFADALDDWPASYILPGWPSSPVAVFERFTLEARQPSQWEIDILDEHRKQREVGVAHAQSASEAARFAADRDGLRIERDDLAVQRDSRTAENQVLVVQRDALTAERDVLATGRDGLIAERDALAAERDTLATDRYALLSQLESLAAQREADASEKARLQAEVGLLNTDLERVRQELRSASSELTRATAELEAVSSQLTEARRLIGLYEGSASWRLTASLRALGRALRSVVGRS